MPDLSPPIAEILACADAAREVHGDAREYPVLRRIMDDRRFLHHQVHVVFEASPIETGDFAVLLPRSGCAEDGFVLGIHPHFAHRPDVLPYLIAYHLVLVNWPQSSAKEAEIFGARLLGLPRDIYYRRICALADSLPASPPGNVNPDTDTPS